MEKPYFVDGLENRHVSRFEEMHEEKGCKHHKEAQFWFFFAPNNGRRGGYITCLPGSKEDRLLDLRAMSKWQQLETE